MKTSFTTCILLFLSLSLLGQHDSNKGKVFHSLEEALKQHPSRVYYLDLKQQDLKTFPKEVLQFTNLIHLNLAHNKIESLEGLDLSMLEDLEELILYDNKFRFFPYAELDTAPNLLVIDLGENDLKALDDQINTLRFLESLDLSGNRISDISNEIKLPFLKTLALERNYIDEFPDFVQQSPKLRSLNIYGNNIKVIPKDINELSKLKHLNIGDNPLETIDQSITLRKLKTLILDWVDLSKPGLDIGFIQKSTLLETLSTEHCNLSGIPEEVFKLRQLKEFSILNNEIVQIDDRLLKSRKLSKLWIGGNQISDPELANLKKKAKRITFIN